MATIHNQTFMVSNPKQCAKEPRVVKRLSDITEESLGSDTVLTDTSLVHVPGMKDSGNRRPLRKTKVKGRKTAEVKPNIPTGRRQPKVATIPTEQQNGKQNKGPADMADDIGSLKKASLKDLCPEDKKRVANLVKELARVGEERETVLKALDNERKQFEGQLEDLLSQQESILKEREDIQRQLMSCQDMLAKYQRLSPDSQDLVTPVSAVHRLLARCQEILLCYQELVLQHQEELCTAPLEHPKSQWLDADDNSEPRRKAELYTPERKQSGSSHRRQDQHIENTSAHAHQKSKYSQQGSSEGQDHLEERFPHRNSEFERNGHRDHLGTQLNGYTHAQSRQTDRNSGNTRNTGENTQNGGLHSSEQYEHMNGGRYQRREGGQSDLVFPQKTYGTVDEDAGNHHKSRTTTSGQNEVVSNGSVQMDRPFTQMIDQLIEGEKHKDPQPLRLSGDFTEPRPSRFTESRTEPQIGPHYSPLNPPVQSSTLRSEHSIAAGPSDFRPLHPDPSPLSSHDSVSYPRGAPSGGVGFHSPVSTKIPNNLSDAEFMQFYQEMNPDDRKKELLAQKQALLKEQQQLKTILSQQEQLLTSKKQQLHKQQEVQKERLEFFEKTGHFPPHNFNEQLLDRKNRVQNGFGETNQKKVQGNVQVGGMEPEFSPHVVPPSGHYHVPSSSVLPPHMYYPPAGPHQIGPPIPGPTQSYLDPAGYMHHPGYYHSGHPHPHPYPPQPFHAQPNFSEQGMVLEALGNMDLAHRQPPTHRQHQGIRPSPQERDSRPAFDQGRSAVPAMHYSNKSSPARQEGRIPSLASHPTSPHRIPTAGLLDIVDEVESLHNRSQGGSTPHRHGYSGNSSSREEGRNRRYEDQILEMYSDDEAEESQVLEDIFFVK